jgi:hypothetical protein
MARGGPPREAGHGEVEATPKEMNGARLAQEAGAKKLEDPIGLHERPPVSVSRDSDRSRPTKRSFGPIGHDGKSWPHSRPCRRPMEGFRHRIAKRREAVDGGRLRRRQAWVDNSHLRAVLTAL